MSGLRGSRSRVCTPRNTHPEPRDLTFCYGVSWHGVDFARHLLRLLKAQGWQE